MVGPEKCKGCQFHREYPDGKNYSCDSSHWRIKENGLLQQCDGSVNKNSLIRWLK